MNKNMFAALAVVAVVAVVALLSASPVMAQNYAQLGVGGASLPQHFDGSYGSVAVGHDFGAVRTDLTYGVGRGIDTKTSGVNTQTVSVNGYFEPVTFLNFTPYIGAGAGIGKYNGKQAYSYDTVLGTSFKFSDRYSVSFQGTHTVSPKIRLHETTYSLGFRANF